MSSSINSVGGGFNYTQMIQKMQDRFKAIDTDSNGTISKAEMQTAKDTKKSLDTWSGASGMQAQSAMSSLMNSTGLSGATTTQDAMTTLQAVLENMASTEKNGGASLQQAIRDKFNKADTNGDDSLSQDEFQADLEAQKSKHRRAAGQMSAQDIQKQFNRVDTNGDGSLNQDEFQGAIQAHQAKHPSGVSPMSAQAMQDKFNEADTNGDGSLSQDEFQADFEANKNKHLNGIGQYEKISSQNSQQGFQDLLSMMTRDTSTGNNNFATQFQNLLQQLGSGSSDKGDTLTKLAALISQNLPSIDVTA